MSNITLSPYNYIAVDGIRQSPLFFSQFQVEKNILTSCNRYDQISLTKPKISITSAHFVDTISSTSLEGQTLTGKKLIVLGNLNVDYILTRGSSCNKRASVFTEILPFSTYIVVPNTICINSGIPIGYNIENYAGFIVANNLIFIAITLLLVYQNHELHE